MNLQAEVNKALETAIKEKVPHIIEKSVETMLTSVLSDVFSSYGPISKSVKEKISQALDINLQQFDLVDYNGLVSQMIKEQLVEEVNLESIKKLTSGITGFINKKEYQLSELVRELMMEEMESSGKSEGSISFHILESTDYDWHEIYLDLDSNVEKNQCAVRFLIHGRDNSIFGVTTQEKYFETKSIPVNPARLTSIRRLGHKIFRLYSTNVPVIIDEVTEEDTSWYNY
ncbi:MAG: hypothetical protein ABJG41_01310 [Cyclobacteriaceae bacterium]